MCLSQDGPHAAEVIYQAEQLAHHYGAELSHKQLTRLQKTTSQVKGSAREVCTVVAI